MEPTFFLSVICAVYGKNNSPPPPRVHVVRLLINQPVPVSDGLFHLSSCPVFEEPEDPSNRSFFSEIISSISDVKFSHNGHYMMTRDYLSVKIWDLNMENRPVETYQVRLGKQMCCFGSVAQVEADYE